MAHGLKISDFGLRLIKAYEGFRPEPVKLISGQTVVGYGHVLSDEDEKRELTRESAEILLRDDLEPIERLINQTVYAPLTQNQFDALVSFAFNIGDAAFRGSHVRHAINNGRILDAATAMDEWRTSEVDGKIYVIDALVRRRTAEKALFLRMPNISAGSSRSELVADQDGSYSPVSDTPDGYAPEIGIVSQAPYVAHEAQYRRAEDGPAGQMGLYEVPARGISDPRNDMFVDDDLIALRDLEDEAEEDLSIPHYNRALNGDAPSDEVILEDILEDIEDEVANDEKPVFQNLTASEKQVDAPPEKAEPAQKAMPEKRAQKSAIALAAEDVSARLDALIGDAKDTNLTPEEKARQDIEKSSAETLEDVTPKSNFTPANDRVEAKETELEIDAKSEAEKDLRGKQAPAPAPDLKRQKQLKKAEERARKAELAEANESVTTWPYAVMMIIGGCLLAAGLVARYAGDLREGTWMATYTPLAIALGAIMLITSVYYALRRRD